MQASFEMEIYVLLSEDLTSLVTLCHLVISPLWTVMVCSKKHSHPGRWITHNLVDIADTHTNTHMYTHLPWSTDLGG